jgi:hypothetical protein
MSTELVPELAVLTDVKTETSAMAGLKPANAISEEVKSAEVNSAGVK